MPNSNKNVFVEVSTGMRSTKVDMYCTVEDWKDLADSERDYLVQEAIYTVVGFSVVDEDGESI
jgi:hypothetical protein